MENYRVDLKEECVYYDPSFLSKEKSQSAYAEIWKETPWKTTAKINRWVCLMEEEENHEEAYKYRDAPSQSIAMTETVRTIGRQASEWYERTTGNSVEFNVCLLNFYEDGQQRIGWHSDREELGRDTPIASVSLGAHRQFLIRSKTDGMRDRATIVMEDGSLIVMENQCQMEYLHSVPREPNITDGRINLTFRCKKESTAGEAAHEQRDEWLKAIVKGIDPDDGAYRAPNSPSTSTVVFGDTASTTMPDDGSTLQYIVTTNLGAEMYCAAELMELLVCDGDDTCSVVALPHQLHGCVGVHGMDADCVDTLKLLQTRSSHHVLRYHTHFSLNNVLNEEFALPKDVPAEQLYAYVKEELVSERLHILDANESMTFRVSCERIGGPHAFQSHQVEYEIGGAISEFYPNATPKMKDFDVNVLVFVVGDDVVIGTQLNVKELSRDRHSLTYRNQSNLAYIMVKCANLPQGGFLVDPFCGSGTILFEAIAMYKKNLHCLGCDVSKRGIEGAKTNAASYSFPKELCHFECSDARGVRRHLEDESVDAVVSNLPWGVMTGKKMDPAELQTLYEVFLRSIWYTLKDRARIVVFVLRGLQFTRILRKLGGRYRILSANVVRTSNNLPCVIVAEKLAIDQLNASLKGQLASLNRFVNFSPEIYQAIHEERLE